MIKLSSFDQIPFVELFRSKGATHVGAAVHLPPNNEGNNNPNPLQSNVVYRSKHDTVPYISRDDLDIMPDNMDMLPFSSHRTNVYIDKIAYLIQHSSDSYPINIYGYVSGTKCQKDLECLSYIMNSSSHGCIQNVCTEDKPYDSDTGLSCDDWQDCQSGRCDYTWYGKLICQPKKTKGFACNENSDCTSGTCSWSFRCK
jgi:hypothetical protein